MIAPIVLGLIGTLDDSLMATSRVKFPENL